MSIYRKYEFDRTGVRREPAIVAAILSGLVFPGVGQYYNRQVVKGLVFTVVELACLVAILYPLAMWLAVAIVQHANVAGLAEVDPARAGIDATLNGSALAAWLVVYVANRLAAPIEAYRSRIRRERATHIAKTRSRMGGGAPR